MFDYDEMTSSESYVIVPTSPVHDRYKSCEGYHAVPPPYTGTCMPPKPDLVFYDASTVSETVPHVFNVEPSTAKPTKDMSQSNRPSAPIIEDWVSDIEDESEGEPMPTQKAHSFVQTSEHVKTPRTSVKPEEGIDYEEVFALVARIEAIRLFLSYVSFMGFMVYQMDVKSDFLYETIEKEVYVCQPPRFEDHDYPDKRKDRSDLVHQEEKGDILLVQVYVDDIIFGSTNKELCKAFEKLMKDKFQMSSMGEITFFLGLQVKQKDNEIFISQDKYVAKILRKFGLTDGKSANTPIDTEKPLLKDPDGEDVDVHIYKSMIGSLMYLTSSRPDIMFDVCAYGKSANTPIDTEKLLLKDPDGEDVDVHIYKSMIGSLMYLTSSRPDIINYAGASLDRKSTTEGCQFLGCRLIFWQCKKQTVVATSSTEAEYVDAVLKYYGFKISC
nr:hypothetical protein [Tanacetum cinerariifolium]